MNIVLVMMVMLMATALVAAQIITRPRDFPGQRRLGVTNYGTHSFGKKGYNGQPVA
ncbi:hypothetical protein Hamer_G013172, partial [Homarus americanus]